MIRLAEPKDANDLARMGEAFFSGIPLAKVTAFDPKSLFKLITTNENVAAFIMEEDGHAVGTAAAIVYPFAFNNKMVVGQELFWWIDPEYRKGMAGRGLHKALEDWAQGRGAKIMFMIAIENGCVNKVERIYNHYGYEKTEHTFMKEL